MADLRAAVGRLRWVAAGMALAALVVAGVMAMVIARRFSRPIDELLKGTVRVREGDFESRVRVESKDEFGTLAASFNVMIRELGLKEKYHDLLGKTSDPGLVHSLLEGRLALGGELRRAAVLFCDIRGFTAMTDGMNPADVIGLLNHHMVDRAMVDASEDPGRFERRNELPMKGFKVPVEVWAVKRHE